MSEVKWKAIYNDETILSEKEGYRKKDIDMDRLSRMTVEIDGIREIDFRVLEGEKLIGPHHLVRGKMFESRQHRTLVVGVKGEDFAIEYHVSLDTGKIKVVES